MALQVPSRYIPMLNSIRTLSGPAAEELVRALSSAKITASSDEMRDRIAPHVSSIPKEELGKITDVLYAMYHVREFSDLNRNSFLKELVESVVEFGYMKVAIYVELDDVDSYSHVAVSDGLDWKSKLGKGQDIAHNSLDLLEGDQADEYGLVAVIMRKPIQ